MFRAMRIRALPPVILLVALAWAAPRGALAAPGHPPGAGGTGGAGGPDDMGTITGMAIGRPGGGFLGLELVDGCFRLSFYNARRKPVAADAAYAILTWPVHYQPNEERDELTSAGDGTFLSSPKLVRPPHAFRIRMGLFSPAGGDPIESHIVDFSG